MKSQWAPLARKAARTLVAALAVLFAGTSTAFAYIDPGTGSMILQLLAAGVVGALFYLRRWRLFFMSWLFGRKSRGVRDNETREESEAE